MTCLGYKPNLIGLACSYRILPLVTLRASIVAGWKRADVYVELRETRGENRAGIPLRAGLSWLESATTPVIS